MARVTQIGVLPLLLDWPRLVAPNIICLTTGHRVGCLVVTAKCEVNNDVVSGFVLVSIEMALSDRLLICRCRVV